MIRILILISITGCANESSNVPELANADDAWIKTYEALSLKLYPQISPPELLDSVVLKFDVDKSVVRHLIRFTTNYTRNEFSVEKVLYRYPHYSDSALKNDLKLLQSSGLATNVNSEEYKLTELGESALDYFYQLRKDKAQQFNGLSEDQVNSVLEVLEKLVKAASELTDFKNESIQYRIDSRPEDFNRLPNVLKILHLRGEYTAFNNDKSHYKYDNYIARSDNQTLKSLNLSALAKELMSATREGRIYPVERCYNQSNWRVGKSGCDVAIDELITKGLLVRQDSVISQSSEGAELSAKVWESADERLYAHWDVLNTDEYRAYLEVLNILNNN